MDCKLTTGTTSNIKITIKNDTDEQKVNTSNGDNPNAVEVLESVYNNRRLDVVMRDWSVCTPLAIMNNLAKDFNTITFCEMWEIYIPEAREKMYLVEYMVGKMKGVGEAPSKKLAQHMAAAEILDKIGSTGKGVVEPYALLPGCRTSPEVFDDLVDFCRVNQLAYPLFEEEVPRDNVEDGPHYTLNCTVGNLTVSASSDSRMLAKRLACKKMYETLTGADYPDDHVVNGGNCIGYDLLLQAGVVIEPEEERFVWPVTPPDELKRLNIETPESKVKSGEGDTEELETDKSQDRVKKEVVVNREITERPPLRYDKSLEDREFTLRRPSTYHSVVQDVEFVAPSTEPNGAAQQLDLAVQQRKASNVIREIVFSGPSEPMDVE